MLVELVEVEGRCCQSLWKRFLTCRQIDKEFSPSMKDEKRNELVNGWQRAVNAAIAWADQ